MLYSLSRTPSASTHRDGDTHSTCKAKKVFALLEVREMFAGYFCVLDFLQEVQTGIRHRTSMGSGRRRGARCKEKVRAG